MISRFIYHSLKYLVSLLTFIQTSFFAMLFLIFWVPFRSIAWFSYGHRLYVLFMRVVCMIYLRCSGIFVTFDSKVFYNMPSTFFLGHLSSMTDYAILFAYLPYEKIILMDPDFFSMTFLKRFFFRLGFFC